MALAEPEQEILVLGERGPTDALIWFYTIHGHQEDDRFTVPDVFRGDNLWVPYVAGQLILSQKMEALVLAGLSPEEACRRRQADGKTYEGLTETPIFKDYSGWMGHWAEDVLPKTHQFNGTGLLVLNGEAGVEENSQRLTTYLEEIINPH